MAGKDMYRVLLVRSLLLRKGSNLAAVTALAMLATVSSALLTLSFDLSAKLSQEFRRFGANVILTPKGASFSVDDLVALRKVLSPADAESDESRVVARTNSGQPVLVVGVNLQQAERMNPWWRLSGANRDVVIGAEEDRRLAENGDTAIIFKGKTISIPAVHTVLHSGGPEEKQVFLQLTDVENTFAQPVNRVELSLSGQAPEIIAELQRILSAVPSANAQPVQQIMEAEAGVVGRGLHALLYTTLIIAFAVALGVLATLSSSILDRRRDFAVMKALGSTQGRLISIFLGETTAMALLAALIGYVNGLGIAEWISRSNFHSSLDLHWLALPIVLVGTLAVAMVSSVVPLMRLQGIEPALILKGE